MGDRINPSKLRLDCCDARVLYPSLSSWFWTRTSLSKSTRQPVLQWTAGFGEEPP